MKDFILKSKVFHSIINEIMIILRLISLGFNPLYAFLGIVFFVLAVIAVRKSINYKNNKPITDTSLYKEINVLGLEKQFHPDRENHTTIDKTIINWKTILLLALALFSLYLLYSDRYTYQEFVFPPSNTEIEQ